MKAYTGDKPFIFVSYAHVDKSIVFKIIELLQNYGYHVWFDEWLHLGNDWHDELAERIRCCDAFLFMCSEESVKSGYCRDEIYAVDSEAKRRMDESEDDNNVLQILTIKLENIRLSKGIGMVLNSKQMLSGVGSDAEEIVRKLVSSKMLEKCRDEFSYLEGVNWGPAREGYYFNQRPDHRVLNSIIDNPLYGDERHFLKINGETSGSQEHLVDLVHGHTYEARVYYCNDADHHLNASGKGVADKVKISVKLPKELKADKTEIMQANIMSANCEHTHIWDQIGLRCPVDAEISYIPATAKIFNRGKLNGTVLSDELFEAGDYIGFNNLSGALPGGLEFRGSIVFKFEVIPIRQVDFYRTVSTDGKTYSDRALVLPGDVVTFRVTMQNNCQHKLDKVTVQDTLPDELEIIPGTVVLYNELNPEGKKVWEFALKNGYNSGRYGSNTHAVIQYKAMVRKDITVAGELMSESSLRYINEKTGDEEALQSEVVCVVQP